MIFSAGNGHFGFPGQHPDVISAGGVFMGPDGSMTASDYASGFMSAIYPGRRVPDLSGLVGMRPKAIYIMLPIEPGDEIDSTPWNAGGLQGGSFPNGDETANNDGWSAFSGTSAAAPQLAGVAALIKQACPRLGPAQIRSIMMSTARDVTTGSSHPNTGGVAAVGPDTATGNGLVDAQRAVAIAKIRCLPIRPPIPPITIAPPVLPEPPIEPIRPILPPIIPPPIIPPPIIPPPIIPPIIPPPIIPPIIPPISPISPISPIRPPIASTTSGQQADSPGVTAEDLEALEEMINENPDIDLEEPGAR